MLTSLISQNNLNHCVSQFGTKSMGMVDDCLNKLEQKSSLEKVSTDANVRLAPTDNVMVKISHEDLDAVTYETALKERFIGHGKMNLANLPPRIGLANKEYEYQDENTKLCFFEPSQEAENVGTRVCYLNRFAMLQRLAAYKEMASTTSSRPLNGDQQVALTHEASSPPFPMPSVLHKIQTKPGDNQIVLRYYSPLDVTQVVTPFEATWEDGTKANIKPLFNYNHNYDEIGQFQGGYDQHAQYFEITDVKAGSTLTLSGKFAETAYFSVVVYNHYAVTAQVKDSELTPDSWLDNPYLPGSKSIFFFTDDQYKDTSITPVNYKEVPQFDQKISLYRSDRQTSKASEEDIAPDGCSRAYLATSRGAETPNYMLLKMKMPFTFFRESQRDISFDRYQVQELSISSTLNNPKDDQPHLDFWSVNSYMLSKLKNADGNIYVLFAPRDIVKKVAEIENLPPRTPPMITLGTGENAFNAYMLSKPTHAVILRYRTPNDNWIGSPANAKCYNTPQEDRPITECLLGEYTPVIKGSDHFPELDNLI